MITVNISDLHFGAMEPQRQYEYLKTQCIDKVCTVPFDVFCIQGDIFDRKFMANNDAIMYASLFIRDALNLCNQKDALLLIISGTSTHDANQLKLFYHLMNEDNHINIVETVQFVQWKQYRILCIPELYGLPEDVYTQALYNSGVYDMAILHGTVKNSIYGYNEATLTSEKHPVFDISHFYNCRGPIMCGHVHVSNCLQKHIYYTGSPYRWQFGEEAEKGFMVCILDDITNRYFVHFEPIHCDLYNTYNLDDSLNLSADDLVNYIKSLRLNPDDHIKIKFTQESNIIPIIKDYFRNNPKYVIDAEDLRYKCSIKAVEQENDYFNKFVFLDDSSLSSEEKLVMVINILEGKDVITVQELTDMMSTM